MVPFIKNSLTKQYTTFFDKGYSHFNVVSLPESIQEKP